MIRPVKPPYGDTQVPFSKTKAQIDSLLEKYGVEQVQWTTDLNPSTPTISLRFFIEYVDPKGIKRRVGIDVRPSIFLVERRTYDPDKGHYVKLKLPNFAQTGRLLYYWLDAKLKAIAWGLVAPEMEFLAEVVVKLPGREPDTFGRLIQRGALPELTGQEERGGEALDENEKL